MRKYIIFGSGAGLNDIFDLIHSNEGVVYKIYQNLTERLTGRELSLCERVAFLGYPVEIHDSLNEFVPEEGCSFALGCLTPQIYVLVEELKAKYRLTLSQLVHPEAYIGSNVHIGEGVTINAHVSIGPNVFLDDFCSVNRATTIGHDVRIGKYTTIGPAVALAGTVRIGNNCRIGIGANVLNFVEIGDWAVIGAGAVVTKNVPEKVVAYGVPARVIRPNDEAEFEVYRARRSF